MAELRVVVPDEIAERLASEAAERGTSTENVAAEVLERRVQPMPVRRAGMPSWVGMRHSSRHDLSERHEEILKSELGSVSPKQMLGYTTLDPTASTTGVSIARAAGRPRRAPSRRHSTPPESRSRTS